MIRSELTPRQETCLLLLSAGMSQAAAARALKLHPTTVWRWMRPGTLFQMIFQERLDKIWEDHRQDTSKILEKVIEASMDLVKQGDINSVLKGSNLFIRAMDHFRPHFPLCPADLTGKCPVRDMISPRNDPTDYERRWAGGDEVFTADEDKG